MKKILFILIITLLTSCNTYYEFNYQGKEVVEYNDTLYFKAIHSHFTKNGENDCVFFEESYVPHKTYYVIENWEITKKRKFKWK